MGLSYTFSVVSGLQANREYYIAMVPLNLLCKIFENDVDYVLPEYRAQRCINENRIPEIRDYILKNRNTYVFSALSASIDGNFEFIPSELDKNIGILKIDMDSVFLINDGQHRKAAIEAALKEDKSLAKETIAIVFFEDAGLKRSQQMFADLNKYAIKPTKSLSTLYDDRDDIGKIVKDIIKKIPFLNKYIDKEKDNLGKNSSKLFTLANFLRANKRILKDDKDEDAEQFLFKYWNSIFNSIKEWKMLENKEIYKKSLREDYILTLGVTLNAFGRLGRYFYENNLDLSTLKSLNSIDWFRCNPEWVGRIINQHGNIVNNEDSIIKLCNYLKIKLKIELSKEEKVKENEIKR